MVELALSMGVMGFLVIATVMAFQWGLHATINARQQMAGNNLLQTINTRLTNMDFFNVFSVDSSSPSFGLWAAYPEMTAMNTILQAAQNVGFTRFTINVTFMRRDLSDSNGNDLTTDLVPFTDANGDNIDDYDLNIRFNDQNTDGDYYDRYGPNSIPEQPDTHIKSLDIYVYKGNRVVASKKGALFSLEQFSGTESASSEAAFSLRVDVPDDGSTLYQALSDAQTAARALPIALAYPGAVVAHRADTGSALTLGGQTEPSGVVSVYLNSPSTGAGLGSAAADVSGNFSFSAPTLTSQLVEGNNRLYALTTKGTAYSPYVIKDLILDVNPPSFSVMKPTGTVSTLSPYVGAVLQDLGVSTTVTSGVMPDVISFFVQGASVPHRFNTSTGKAAWLDPTHYLPLTLINETDYTVIAQGGDYAQFKTTQSWTFHVAIDNNDATPPEVSNRQPTGGGVSSLPTISCQLTDPESGVNPASIVLTVDGAVVASTSSVTPLGLNYDGETGTVSYTPSTPFASLSLHTVRIHAEHWSANPANPANRILDVAYNPAAEWTFTCAP